jgi:hypothetical protein
MKQEGNRPMADAVSFKTLQIVALGEVLEAVAVLTNAIRVAEAMETDLAAARSAEELDMVMEKIGRANPLPYLIVAMVGPLRAVEGGLKPVHAAAMIECAMQVETMAQEMSWQARFAGMGAEEIVKALVEMAAHKKANLQ